MKKLNKIVAIGLLATISLGVGSTSLFAQHKKVSMEEKMKRPSLPATVTQTLKSGAIVTIDYSRPHLKNRVIGTSIEPKDGEVWRAGANEATTFETSKDVTINGQILPKGKYALFVKTEGDVWTVIFNKVWDTWGSFSYEKNKAEDALTTKASVKKLKKSTEVLTYTISKKGEVQLLWGQYDARFTVK